MEKDNDKLYEIDGMSLNESQYQRYIKFEHEKKLIYQKRYHTLCSPLGMEVYDSNGNWKGSITQ